MTDEKYLFMEDCREKASIGRSARNKRTHNGRRGSVKFVSDYLTKKELEAMNGETKTWYLNDPMTWAEFKTMPDDLKKHYISQIRERFGAPDKYIAEMLGVSNRFLSRVLISLKLNLGKGANHKPGWKREEFYEWCGVAPKPSKRNTKAESEVESETVGANPVVETESKVEPETATVETVVEAENKADTDVVTNPVSTTETEGKTVCTEPTFAVPTSGYMTYEGNIHDILRTIGATLFGANVHLKVEWDVID